MSLLPKRMFPPLLLLGAVLLPAAAGAQRNDARSAIPALNAKLTAAYNAGHPETVARAYAPDAVILPPNGAAIRGAQGIADWWAGAAKAGLSNIVLTTGEVYAQGNLATETGTYSYDVPAPGGGTTHGDHGKYMVLWKRSPTAGWQLFRDIFNSDMPAPQGATPAASAQAQPAAAADDSIWLVLNPIRADKRADYEQWLTEFGKAGAQADDARIRRRFTDAHAIIPATPNADGTWTYVIMLYPYHAGEDYMINSLTRQIVPAADTARLTALLAGARAGPVTVIRGRMTAAGMVVK